MASGAGSRARPGIPFLLETLAQAIASLRQRHARDHRLQEAEHDELAGLIRRDPAAFEVEELGLVDRADGARMGSAAAIGIGDCRCSSIGDKDPDAKMISRDMPEAHIFFTSSSPVMCGIS